VDYSLLMAVSMVLMSKRLEKHLGAASFSVFHVSPPPPLRNTEGVFI
jgi:hypothetical protein